MYEAVVAVAALVANDADTAFRTYEAVVAFAALVANEDDTAFKTYEAVAAVPSNEPVKLVAVTLPLMLREPVTVWVSAMELPIVTPVFVT